MTSQHDADAVHARACENCSTPLQGEYCHQCGQHAHNPLRSFGHAVEDVFESFWHLDGRIFRTLRTMLSPGQLANAYLAGHRAPFVAPMRLFVVLSVLTFFVARFTVQPEEVAQITVQPDAPAADGARPNLMAAPGEGGGVDFSRLATVDEVVKLRDETLDGLVAAHASVPPGVAFVRERMKRNILATQRAARERIAALQPDHPLLQQPDRFPEDEPLPEAEAQADAEAGVLFRNNGKPYHPTDNPVRIEWLPEFANRWLNKKLARGLQNIPRLQEDPEHFKNVLLGSVPSALFVLVPMFALLLKLAYLGTRRMYLEHLVVALYSHAYLCLCVLALCLCSALGGVLPAWGSVPLGFLQVAIVFWMPVYLFLMQLRVYRQHWLFTALKFTVLGTLYFMMLVMAIIFLALTTWVSA